MAELMNLKRALEYFGISNLELAKGTEIDPSLISRYLSGQRQLKAASKQANAIAEYLLVKADSGDKIDWLEEQFEEMGIPTDISSVFRMKDNLIAWISTDGMSALTIPSSFETEGEIPQTVQPASEGRGVLIGLAAVMDELTSLLRDIPDRAVLDVFLTSDRIRLFSDPGFVALIRDVIAGKHASLNIVICVSGNTQSLNRVVNCYMGNMVEGSMQFYTFFGATQNIAEQMYIVIRGRGVAMITETPVSSSKPVGIFVSDEDFIEEISHSFNTTYRFSQPMFNLYSDSQTRNMIEVLYTEYCLPGSLCVVKDSVNPMYMSYENYCRVLRDNNADDGQYMWKCGEYKRFKEGFDNMLSTGMDCREIISYKRLRAILRDGKCQMAGLYFLGSGFFNLDARGCRDILTGYIEYLEKYPNFSLLILDDLPELHSSNCWHVKQNSSIAINDWSGDAPVMLQSNHNVLVHEFQTHYDEIWERGKGSLRNRVYMISILKKVIEELNTKYGLPEE